MAERTLYYGDNLTILRDYFRDEVVDLIYLDPPFNSSRNYNVLFKNESGREAESQVVAFADSWHWGESAEKTYFELLETGPAVVATMISAMRQFVGTNQMMAYLVMMTSRLLELHRVLKPTGSLYLHCDPTASHYLKVILDTVFGGGNFRSEITWKRTSAHGNAKRNYAAVNDIILYYGKSDNFIFNQVFTDYSDEYVGGFYRYVDENGRRYRLDNLRNPGYRPNLIYDYKGFKPHPNGWAISKEKMERLDQEGRLYFPKKPDGRIQLKRFLDEMPGNPITNSWDDISPIGAQAAERLGFPTQKPLALLERIILASSNEGDLVLDPFSGCGTAVAAAQKLGRRWAGIDITHLAIAMHKLRLRDMYGLEAGKDYEVVGEPTDIGGARQLAQDNRYQFQWWALALIQARPLGGGEGGKGKKGADGGIDGIIPFVDDSGGKLKRVLVQVKSGHVKSGDIRDLRGVLDREQDAPIGVFLTLEKPSQEMIKEAVTAGMYESKHWGKFPRVQILTIEEILGGARVKMPTQSMAFRQAERVKEEARQERLDL